MLRKVATACVCVLCLLGALTAVVGIIVAVKLQTPRRAPRAAVHAYRPAPPQGSIEERYLDLMKRSLTRYGYDNGYSPLPVPQSRFKRWAYATLNHFLFTRGQELVLSTPISPEIREEGRDWPRDAETMVGLKRLDNLQFCTTDVIRRNVPGDLIECGAWRGGSCIFMRAVLAAYGVKDRTVWVSDSFEGLPRPDPILYAADADPQWSGGEMAVSLDEAQRNFLRYGLLDQQVKFLKGWFRDTLPNAPIGRLAVLRVDGDLYESVTQTLQYMYPKVSIGGYVILDDYGDHLPAARQAVDDYRKARGITEPLERIDHSGVYWRRER